MSIRVRTRKAGKSFYIIEEVYGEKAGYNPIPKIAYGTLGFDSNWTYKQANEHAKLLNKKSRAENRKKVGAARRVDEADLTASLKFPAPMILDFETTVLPSLATNPARERVLKHMWSTAKGVIKEIDLMPNQFFSSKERFYKLFIGRSLSADYSQKLLMLINRWGEYYAVRTDTAFIKVPPPKGSFLQALKKANAKEPNKKKAAKPFTWDQLKNAKSKWEANDMLEQWNWLFIALWFCLRPTEVNNLTPENEAPGVETENEMWFLSKSDQHKGIEELRINQTKLANIDWIKRWKRVPVLYDEQREALKIIKAGLFKCPHSKTISSPKYFGKGYGQYSPRKGATDHFLALGHLFDDVSIFMGHHSLSQTWEKYKDKTKYNLPEKK